MTPTDQRLQADGDLERVLSTPFGRRFIWGLIGHEAGGSSSTYSGENTHHTAFLEGRRSIGVELLQDVLRVAPTEFVHMLNDALVARETERLETERKAKEERDANG